MGLLHSATGGWTLPLALLLAIALAQIVVAHLLSGGRMARTPVPAGPVTAGTKD
jgi:CP family cyanate transporter-like MFS transporter